MSAIAFHGLSGMHVYLNQGSFRVESFCDSKLDIQRSTFQQVYWVPDPRQVHVCCIQPPWFWCWSPRKATKHWRPYGLLSICHCRVTGEIRSDFLLLKCMLSTAVKTPCPGMLQDGFQFLRLSAYYFPTGNNDVTQSLVSASLVDVYIRVFLHEN